MKTLNYQSNENSATNHRPLEATDQLYDTILAKLIDVEEKQQPDHMNCSSKQEVPTVNKEDFFSECSKKSENKLERFKQEQKHYNFTTSSTLTLSKTPTNDSDKFFAELIKIIETILRNTSTAMHSKSLQNVDIYEYICRKSRMLVKRRLTNRFAGVYQDSKDYFSANKQSIEFINNFFKVNENLLWTKVSDSFYFCHICEGYLKYKRSLIEHLNMHFEHYHVCEICTKKFSSLKALKKHTRSKHNLLIKSP